MLLLVFGVPRLPAVLRPALPAPLVEARPAPGEARPSRHPAALRSAGPPSAQRGEQRHDPAEVLEHFWCRGAHAGRAPPLTAGGPRAQAQARLTDAREAVVAPLAAASARLRAGLGPPAAPQLAEPAAPRSAADDAAAWLGGALRPLRELVSASAPGAEGVSQPGSAPPLAVQEPEAEGAGAWVGGALRGLGLQWGSQARAESPRAVADGAAGAGRAAPAPAADELPLLGGALRRLQQVRARRMVPQTAMRLSITWAPSRRQRGALRPPARLCARSRAASAASDGPARRGEASQVLRAWCMTERSLCTSGGRAWSHGCLAHTVEAKAGLAWWQGFLRVEQEVGGPRVSSW